MAEKFVLPEPLVFFDGVQSGDTYYFAVMIQEDRESDTVFLKMRKGVWSLLGDVSWPVVSISGAPLKLGSFAAIGNEGLLVYPDLTESEILEDRSIIHPQFTARRLKHAANMLYAVGYGGRYYECGQSGSWVSRDFCVEPEASWIESLATDSEDRIVLVGLRGEVRELNNGELTNTDIGTNCNLNDICFASDGRFYVCGYSGALLIGAHDTWRVVPPPLDIQLDFWKVVEWNGRIWVGSMNYLFEWTERGLQVQNLGPLLAGQTFFNISSSRDGLLIVSERSVLLFNGSDTRYIYSDP